MMIIVRLGKIIEIIAQKCVIKAKCGSDELSECVTALWTDNGLDGSSSLYFKVHWVFFFLQY